MEHTFNHSSEDSFDKFWFQFLFQPKDLYKFKISNLVMGSHYHLGIQGRNTKDAFASNESSISFATPSCWEVHDFNTSLCRKSFVNQVGSGVILYPHFWFTWFYCHQLQYHCRIWHQLIHWWPKGSTISMWNGNRFSRNISQFITRYRYFPTTTQWIRCHTIRSSHWT